MTLTRLLETAILVDFQKEPLIAGYCPKPHDFNGPKDGAPVASSLPPEAPVPARLTVTVTATDNGDFVAGSGIRRVRVEVEARENEGGPDTIAQLDRVEELISDRLQPSTTIAGVTGRESLFSNARLKVFGILSSEPTTRKEAGMERIRVVSRTFIAAQLA